MQVAIVCAGFTPAEADQLRRAMATFKLTGGVSHFRDKLIDGHGRARLHARFRRAHLQADRGLRLLRLPRKPRRELRADRLCRLLAEVPPSGRVLRGAAERAADGLLRAGADRARCARSMASRCGRSASTRSRWDCTLEPAGGGSSGGAARPAHGEGTGQRGRRADRRAHAASGRTHRSRMYGAAPACRRPRSSGWPRPTPFARSALTGGRRCGRSGASRPAALPLFAAADRDRMQPELAEPAVALRR